MSVSPLRFGHETFSLRALAATPDVYAQGRFGLPSLSGSKVDDDVAPTRLVRPNRDCMTAMRDRGFSKSQSMRSLVEIADQAEAMSRPAATPSKGAGDETLVMAFRELVRLTQLDVVIHLREEESPIHDASIPIVFDVDVAKDDDEVVRRAHVAKEISPRRRVSVGLASVSAVFFISSVMFGAFGRQATPRSARAFQEETVTFAHSREAAYFNAPAKPPAVGLASVIAAPRPPLRAAAAGTAPSKARAVDQNLEIDAARHALTASGEVGDSL